MGVSFARRCLLCGGMQRGDWEKAHAVAQDVAGVDGAWVHAYLQEGEGCGYASYWYRRAGRAVAAGDLKIGVGGDCGGDAGAGVGLCADLILWRKRAKCGGLRCSDNARYLSGSFGDDFETAGVTDLVGFRLFQFQTRSASAVRTEVPA